jgi:hypothetical protein
MQNHRAARCHVQRAVTESRMQDIDDPHDDPFADAGPDPEFSNEWAWIDAGTAKRGQPVAFAASGSAPAMGSARFSIDWSDAHREPTYPADPAYPNGHAMDVALDAPQACRAELPYPAARIGTWIVHCRVCGYRIALATTGRSDDPRSVRVPCRLG